MTMVMMLINNLASQIKYDSRSVSAGGELQWIGGLAAGDNDYHHHQNYLCFLNKRLHLVLSLANSKLHWVANITMVMMITILMMMMIKLSK